MSEPAEKFEHKVSETIRKHAMTFPQSEEGSSCVNRAFKAGGKNFAFLGEKPEECKLRLKLKDSVVEMESLQRVDPQRYQIGTSGWTLLTFPPDDPPPSADLKRWITESFHLLAPKKVISQLTPK